MFCSIYATNAAFLNKLVRSVYLLTLFISLLLCFYLDPFTTVLSPQSDRWGLACLGGSCRRIGCGVRYLIGPRRPYHSGHDERLRVDLRRSWKESPSLAQSLRLFGARLFTITANSPLSHFSFPSIPKFTTTGAVGRIAWCLPFHHPGKPTAPHFSFPPTPQVHHRLIWIISSVTILDISLGIISFNYQTWIIQILLYSTMDYYRR